MQSVFKGTGKSKNLIGGESNCSCTCGKSTLAQALAAAASAVIQK